MYKIIGLIGESGCGKDSIMDAILALNPDLHPIVNCTTRPRREGEVHGIDYFYYTPEQFGDMVLHDEMLECTVFNDWFYGTSYDSIRSDCVNIGVFNPTAAEALAARPDVELVLIRIVAPPKTRLLRQLNREEEPDVDEIVRRYQADKIDFANIEADCRCMVVWNDDGEDLKSLAQSILIQLGRWTHLGNLD